MANYSDGEWHLEVTLVRATLRRYSGQDASEKFDGGKPFDAVMSVDVCDENAYISAALAKEPTLTTKDTRTIKKLLGMVGASTFSAKRGGVTREFAKYPVTE